MDAQHLGPMKQAITGTVIAAAGGGPLWLQIVEGVTSLAGMVATVCGAIIGLVGVWRLLRNRRQGKPDKEGGAA